MGADQAFIEVRVCVGRQQVAAVEALMEAQGAVAVTLTDSADVPVLEPPLGATPLWPEVVVCGLFPGDMRVSELKSVISLAPGVESPDRVVSAALQDQDWAETWRQGLEPMRFGQGLWIVPSHCEAPVSAETVLRLDPGLAFGSGTHPSTRLCLEWIDSHRIEGAAVTDFGCGSGVLAVAAALKGAARVSCVDTDPQALFATRRNAEANEVTDRLQILPPEDYGGASVDIVLANILSGTLVELAPMLMKSVRPGGWLVLAGILGHQAGTVAAAYSARFPELEMKRHGEWVRLAGRARG